ncbi:hypothetical protein N9995_00345, partial [bacterium]|nr:hypothetical protein [bacterium]
MRSDAKFFRGLFVRRGKSAGDVYRAGITTATTSNKFSSWMLRLRQKQKEKKREKQQLQFLGEHNSPFNVVFRPSPNSVINVSLSLSLSQ